MFDEIYRSKYTVIKHQNGPLRESRERIILSLKQKKRALSTLTYWAENLLLAAEVISTFPENYIFDERDISIIVKEKLKQSRNKIKSSKHSFIQKFSYTLRKLLQETNQLYQEPKPFTQYSSVIDEFVQTKSHLSIETQKVNRGSAQRFFSYININNIQLKNIKISDIDLLIETKNNCKPISKYNYMTLLINLLKFCEFRGYCQQNLHKCIVRPRIWKKATIPSAIPWDIVQKIINVSRGSKTKLRDKAILLLLATYGFRSSEIRHLKLKDINWENNLITIHHTKNYLSSIYPLDIETGNAIVNYIISERPKVKNVFLFLTTFFPYKELQQLGNIISPRVLAITKEKKTKLGPHAIRHAVAQYLLKKGTSYKTIGDQFGHSAHQSTEVYAKIDFNSLKVVSYNDIEYLLSNESLNCKKDYLDIQGLEKVKLDELEGII